MGPKRATVRDVRRRNRSVLLSTLFFGGPLSRLELSAMTGLSAATASNVTAELLDERLIVEAGQVESDGGRPRVLLRVDPGYGNVIGVDVGETGVKVELFDLAMTRKATVEEPLPSARPDPAAVADQVASGVREVIVAAGVAADTVIAAGIGVPGIVAQGATPLIHAPTIGWRAVALERLLRDRKVALPLFMDNGAKTQGQAEMWFGAGRGVQHAVIALVGSGVGAAVINHGSIYRGVSSSAGEWGHTTIVYGGRACRCGAHGCLEAYVGAEAVIDRYRKLRRGRAVPGTDELAQIRAVLDAAGTSKAAADLLDETAGLLGAGIANLINLFNPERVVLGGWAGLALGAQLLPAIRAAAKAQSLDHPYGQASIELCQLGPDAVAFGAATLPIAAMLALGADPREDRRVGLPVRDDVA